jgi:hypothetical protein
MSYEQLKEIYKQWCKETKRNGGVLIGPSIQELLKYIAEKQKGA